MAARKTRLARFGLIVFGFCLALFLLEMLLQLSALVASTVWPRAEIAGLSDRRRVLSLGDSNTYGLYVERDEAYPQVLERLWNADPGRRPVNVLNLGFPGTNSSTVRMNLPGLMREIRPELVTVLVGVNDIWTVPDPEREADAGGRGIAYWAWKFSRLYRLYYMRSRSFETPDLDGEFSARQPLGFEERHVRVTQGTEEFEFDFEPAGTEVAGWSRILADNLEAIIAITEEHGAELVFLTYLSDDPPYDRANRVLRRFAASHPVRLIDTGADLRPACPRGRCAELLRDQHPSALGYERVARMLLRELQ